MQLTETESVAASFTFPVETVSNFANGTGSETTRRWDPSLDSMSRSKAQQQQEALLLVQRIRADQKRSQQDKKRKSINWGGTTEGDLSQWLQQRIPSRIRPPRPVQIVQEYIEQHSVVVHGATAREGQKYIIVSYVCPHRAGNILATFLNQMLLAVLTNRTAVFVVRGARGEQECDKILQRAPWIPRLEKGSEPWKERFKYDQRVVLLAESAKQLQVSFDPRTFQANVLRELSSRNTTAAILAQDISHHHVIELRAITGCFHSFIQGWEGRFDWTVPTCRDYLSSLFHEDVIDSTRATQLFELGIDFVYGMLFRLSFDLTPDLLNSISYSGVFDPKAFSVGVHSRHPSEKLDGSDVSHERNCLDRVMKRRPTNATCQLLIMSDRPATNQALQAYATEQDCEGIVVQHSRGGDGQYLANTTGFKGRGKVSAEHGPFEGAGYYKDLALVSRARDALVCTMRSSSAIIKQLIEYDSVMRYYDRNSGSMEGYQSPETCYFEGRENLPSFG